MTHITEAALMNLSLLAKVDAEAVAWASYDWLHINEAGLPYVALLDAGVRQDARFWAETANPAELECYALAACDKLSGMTGHAPFASRQIKRLAGALWRRMSPVEKSAFAAWIADQMKDNGDEGQQ